MPGGKLPDRYISTRDAARLLGCGIASIETGLRNGTFPIGWAWCTKEESRRGQWNYRIPRQAFLNAVENGRVYPAKYAKERTVDWYEQER